jgi:acyl carrier protein
MYEVSFEDFSSEFVKDLELKDDFYLRAPLKDVPEYDSMGKITVSLLIEKIFGFQINYETLDETESIRALYDYCIMNYLK